MRPRREEQLTWRGRCAGACLVAALSAATLRAEAFVVAPASRAGEYLKWGRSLVAGTPGGVVTWGFAAAGTPGGAACVPYCRGTSLGELANFYPMPARDNHTEPLPLAELHAAFQAAFDAWSRVADVEFRYLGIDSSKRPFNDEAANTPMIRIGIFAFDGTWAHCMAAAAFAPPPNLGSIAGDILLNANVGFQRSNAPEGGPLPDFPVGGGLHLTDLRLLALHEVGHAIGLGDTTESQSVLCSDSPDSALLRRHPAWRGPQADDVAGARFLYGPPRGGAKPGGALRRRRSRRLRLLALGASHRVKPAACHGSTRTTVSVTEVDPLPAVHCGHGHASRPSRFATGRHAARVAAAGRLRLAASAFAALDRPALARLVRTHAGPGAAGGQQTCGARRDTRATARSARRRAAHRGDTAGCTERALRDQGRDL